MTRRELVLVHGRAQQDKSAYDLKAAWLEAWRVGLEKSGLPIPICEDTVRFPYYGDTLFDLASGSDEVADVIVRGDGAGEAEKAFMRAVLEEVRREAGVTEEQLEAVEGREVIERGPQNWRWVRGIVRALDRFVPGASGTGIAMATHDVFHYLRNQGVRDAIDTGVRRAITPGTETVVVGHSLGSVVAYSLLRRDGGDLGWKVPLYVTVGSPLGVTAIREGLAPISHPDCVAAWFNAMDQRDIVALYPLDEDRFGVDPAIENKTDVDNDTPNRHGISGYLADREVARRIYEAIVGSSDSQELRPPD